MRVRPRHGGRDHQEAVDHQGNLTMGLEVGEEMSGKPWTTDEEFSTVPSEVVSADRARDDGRPPGQEQGGGRGDGCNGQSSTGLACKGSRIRSWRSPEGPIDPYKGRKRLLGSNFILTSV